MEPVPADLIDTVCAMRVTLVEDLNGLQGEWTALFDADTLAAPFLSFEWLSVWCRHWGSQGTPWILAVRDGERLAGLALFQLSHRRGMRFLTGLGVGFGDYWDVLAAPEDRERATEAVAAALRQRSSEWDALVVDKLPEDSIAEAVLHSAGLRVQRPARLPSPRIVLPETFDAYLAGLSKNRRWRIRRNLKAIDNGELTVRTVSEPAAMLRTLERWQALRVEWWEKREREMLGEHGSERFLAFTQDVVLALAPLNRAVVWEVSDRDQLIGVTVNFLDESTFYYWLWGFDSRFEDLRPGHTLIAYGIRWSIETGRRYFDFMIGGESYKYDYAPEERGVMSMTVGNNRPRSRAALGLSRLKHTMSAAEPRARVLGRRVRQGA
jgi:CelD/BcsL family acetyltransferase involved in cellulose biosynthesis